MEIKGFALDGFTDPLNRVSDDQQARPIDLDDLLQQMSPLVRTHAEEYYDGNFSLMLRNLPKEALTKLSFDQLAKLRYSNLISEDLFREDPRLEIVRKIKSSMWRWGGFTGDCVWNEVVDCYDAMRRFNIPLDDFTIRLDYTTGYNEQGYSQESRTFLDGVFAFLVYYRGEHVMTLGFSVTQGHNLLVQQVQLKNPRGNRFLFRFPANRLEYCISRFEEAFTGYTIHIVDGENVATKSLKSYREGLKRAKVYIADDRRRIADGETEHAPRSLHRHLEEKTAFSQKIAHLEHDVPRLKAFYANTGVYRLGKPVAHNGLLHYRLSKRRIMQAA